MATHYFHRFDILLQLFLHIFSFVVSPRELKGKIFVNDFQVEESWEKCPRFSKILIAKEYVTNQCTLDIHTYLEHFS